MFTTINRKPDPSLIRLSKDNIYRALGMRSEDSDEHLSSLIEQYMDKSRNLCKPCISFSVWESPEFNVSEGELYLGGLTFNLGREVAAFLLKSSRIVVFAVTCGDAIEQFSRALMKQGHALEGLLVDIIGSELAEDLAESLHQQIEMAAAAEQWNTTNRYSPGYCNWPVSDQQNLFSLLGDDRCGIEVTPVSLMIPVKSVSGMLGIGAGVRKMAYKCHLCSDEHCIMRRGDFGAETG
jgi:hypothetical protein